jgi:hypothetical protein
MEEFDWKIPKGVEKPVADGDLREVLLPVKTVFEWSDKIVKEYDYENDKVLEYTSGFVMKVVPDQEFIYNNEKSVFLASTIKEKPKVNINRWNPFTDYSDKN